MLKKKIHELAKEINIKSKDIVSYMKDKGIEKTHMSSVDESEISLIKTYFIKTSGTAAYDKSENKSFSNKEDDKKQLHESSDNSKNNERRPETGHGDKNRRPEGANQGNKDRRPEGGYQGNRDRRPEGGYQGNRDRRPEGGYQGNRDRRLEGTNQGNTENRPEGGYQGNRDRRPDGGYQGNRDRRPEGGYQGNRDRRPEGTNQGNTDRRPEGGYQGNRDRRPEGGNQGNRDRRPEGGYQGNRENRPEGGYQGNRENRPGGYQGNRENRPEGGYQGNRENRPGGYQGNRENRPEGGYQGNRDRRPEGGYQDRRPTGGNQNDRDRRPSGGYQGNREQRPEGGYQGNRENRPSGGYQGNRDNRPTGGYQGDRRPEGIAGQGDRRPGGYQGDRRPGGTTGQGDRRPGGPYQGDRRPGTAGQGDRRPMGQNQGGYKTGFNAGFDKDKDSGTGNRVYDKRRQDNRTSDKSNIKTDLVNEISKEQRAVAFKEKDRDRNKSKKRDDVDKEFKRTGKGKKDPNRKGAFIMPKPQQVQKEPEDEIKVIEIPEYITIKELAEKMRKPASIVVKKLFLEGKAVSINKEISFEEAEEIAISYDIIAEKEIPVDIVAEILKEDDEDESLMDKRPPVVCVMGHVDHGKTSLLDAIRETNVTSREAGGITQHIGAYVVEINGETITFLDTPGHEAFTSMRMRGAKSTDIAILVVAADDGVMPQTVEAISHAKAAGVQIIVAINKIDKPSANIERVKQELTEHNLIAEDWGGDTVFVPVSAHTKEGIDTLLEMILLTADILELKANKNRNARGIVIEAELDKGKGTVATILVQKGTLHVGDSIAIGASYGKVRAMMDDKGRRVSEATVSTPVEILGLNDVPNAGEIFIATNTEKDARNIADTFIKQGRERLLADTKAKLSLDGLFTQIKAGNIKELNIIVKADVQGSVEAVKQSMLKLSNEEVAVRIIHGGVGTVNESDVTLAATSNAIIIGFNVRTDNTSREIAEREKVDLRLYKVIYSAIEDVEAAMKGLLDPIYEEKVIAHAEIRQIFKASGIGIIAGSYVLDGKITRGALARVSREGKKIYEGTLASLKRFKDDVKEVATGYECGLVFDKFNDLQEFDQVEFYVMKEVPR